jgi:hypothetical protein
MICRKCGTQNRPEAEICIACNQPLSPPPPAAPHPPPPPPPNLFQEEYEQYGEKRTCGLAVASLVLGISGFLCVGVITGPIGLILGSISLGRINRMPRTLEGKGLAIAGIITSGLSILLSLSILLPALDRARELAKRVQCASQLHSIGIAINLYQNENRDQNPPNLKLLTTTEDLDPKMLICPSSDDEVGEVSYVYRGEDLDASAPAFMIIAYDKYENHQGEARNVLFADFVAKKYDDDDFRDSLRRDNEYRRENGLTEKTAIE